MTTTTTTTTNDDQHRRLVLFAGPHKSASSSVQEFFMKYASSIEEHQHRHPALVNWTWPYNPRRRSYQPRKGFAPLVTEGPGFVQLLYDTLLDVWGHDDDDNRTSSSSYHNQNLILGTEELDRFGSTPWSHRNGIQAIRGIQNLTQASNLQVVVNYRRPRQEQWISIWKQLTRTKETNNTYADYLCTNDPIQKSKLWEYLDCVANPLGLVQALLQQQPQQPPQNNNHNNNHWKVDLMDMQGIATQGLDVAHIIACQVLQVPCTSEHWLEGIERPILRNKKIGDPGLSLEQLDDLEWILRQRDCGYRSYLQHHPNLQVHYGDTLWEGCDDDDEIISSSSFSSSLFVNTTFLLELLQSQVGCGSGSGNNKNMIRQWRHPQQPTTTTKVLLPEAPTTKVLLKKQPHLPLLLVSDEDSGKVLTANNVANKNSSPKEVAANNKDDPMLQSAKSQLYGLYLLLLFVIAYFFRHLKCKRQQQPQRRRLAGTQQLLRRR
jgi:hypothetical protein